MQFPVAGVASGSLVCGVSTCFFHNNIFIFSLHIFLCRVVIATAQPAPILDAISGSCGRPGLLCVWRVYRLCTKQHFSLFFYIFLRRVFMYIFFKTCFRDVFPTFPVFFVWRLYRPLYKTYFFVFFHETRASEKKVECGVVIALFHSFGFGAKTHFFSLCLCGVVIGPLQKHFFKLLS